MGYEYFVYGLGAREERLKDTHYHHHLIAGLRRKLDYFHFNLL